MWTFPYRLRHSARTPLAGLLLAALLPGTPGWAQAPVAGDGLTGEYYRGPNFNRFVSSRLDTAIAFDWQRQRPVPDVPAEFFSVRWTGWLAPPVSGRYLFHASVDDGIRIRVNDRLIMDEWRPQRVRDFTAAVELEAGETYPIRIEYFQDIVDTRVVVTWQPPSAIPQSAAGNGSKPSGQPISARYLFSTDPTPVTADAVEAPNEPAAAAVTEPEPSSSTSGARPAAEIGIALPEIYFESGQAQLLPAALTALNQLAAALRTAPQTSYEVQGHTDNRGSADLNRRLSQQRAEAVCLYLVSRGVPLEQLRPVSYASTRPVTNNASDEARRLNRRVALRRL